MARSRRRRRDTPRLREDRRAVPPSRRPPRGAGRAPAPGSGPPSRPWAASYRALPRRRPGIATGSRVDDHSTVVLLLLVCTIVSAVPPDRRVFDERIRG